MLWLLAFGIPISMLVADETLSVTLAAPLQNGASVQPASAAWNAEMAAHLLRRAGFGGSPEQVQFLVELGRSKAVDYLVDYEKIPQEAVRPRLANPIPGERLRQRIRDLDEDERNKLQQKIGILRQLNLREMTTWWMEQMVSTPRPLQEKMVLFWHGHFTSGVREVQRTVAMFDQNDLYRRMATGNFRELLVAVSRDPAMLLYLNNAQNQKQRPNENFARELLELFTLGVGHYTERDIRETARAFTGWTVNGQTGDFVFNRRTHDDGEKTFRGHKGNFDGEDIIEIILTQPACAEHVVRRLWKFFASDEEPPVREVKALARVLRDSDYEIKPVLRSMFKSDAFFASHVMHAHVKSPVELIVGTLRALEVAPDDCGVFTAACRMMGQELFQPPSVKGWDGGLTWINTATLYNRYNLLGYVVYGTPARSPEIARQTMQAMEMAMDLDAEFGITPDDLPSPSELLRHQAAFDPMPIVKKLRLNTAEKIVDHFVARLLQQPISAERRRVLINEYKRVAGDASSATSVDAIRGVIHLIMSMPEYQLN